MFSAAKTTLQAVAISSSSSPLEARNWMRTAIWPAACVEQLRHGS
jgi:hypothetical protein